MKEKFSLEELQAFIDNDIKKDPKPKKGFFRGVANFFEVVKDLFKAYRAYRSHDEFD